MLAANLDIAESDLTAIDPRELALSISGGGATSDARGPAEELSPDEQERRQAVWWYLLVAGILLLAVETVLANRLPARPA